MGAAGGRGGLTHIACGRVSTGRAGPGPRVGGGGQGWSELYTQCEEQLTTCSRPTTSGRAAPIVCELHECFMASSSSGCIACL